MPDEHLDRADVVDPIEEKSRAARHVPRPTRPGRAWSSASTAGSCRFIQSMTSWYVAQMVSGLPHASSMKSFAAGLNALPLHWLKWFATSTGARLPVKATSYMCRYVSSTAAWISGRVPAGSAPC
ncbi:hypothetical protein NKG05_16900 [Oerskovia sp. M15]